MARTRKNPTAADRSLNARYAAQRMHGQNDSIEVTANARRAFLDGFERQADPEGVLDPLERARRAGHLKSAHFTKLAILSAQARRKQS